MARRFLVVGHTQTTDPGFALDDLTGAAGRLDVMARAVTSALCVSHGLRADTEIWCALPGRDGARPMLLRFEGATLRSLNPDERSTAALFRKAFAADVVPDGHFETVHPGLHVALVDPLAAIGRLAEKGPLALLDRAGEDLRVVPDSRLRPPGADLGFVLSDHRPLADDEVHALDVRGAIRVSAGGQWLQGHHVVTLVHDELDRRT